MGKCHGFIGACSGTSAAALALVLVHTGCPIHQAYRLVRASRGTLTTVLAVPCQPAEALAEALRALHDPHGPANLDTRLGRLAGAAPEGTGFVVGVDDQVWVFPSERIRVCRVRGGDEETLSQPQVVSLARGDRIELRCDPEEDPIAGLHLEGDEVAGYAVMAGMGYYFANRHYPIPFEWGRIGRIALAALLCYGVSLTAPEDLLAALAVKAGALALFPAALYLLGFFRPDEIRKIKSLLTSTS